MKSFFTLLIVLMISFSNLAHAGNSELFSYDKTTLKLEFADLDLLEAMLIATPTTTLDASTLTPEISSLYNRLQLQSPLSLSGIGAASFDFPSFLMGLCCCPIGVFTIAFDDDKTKEERNSFGVGAIGFVALGCSSYLLYAYVIAVNTTTF